MFKNLKINVFPLIKYTNSVEWFPYRYFCFYIQKDRTSYRLKLKITLVEQPLTDFNMWNMVIHEMKNIETEEIRT